MESPLQEKIPVPLPVLMPVFTRLFPYGRSGIPSFGIIKVGFRLPSSVFYISKERGFRPVIPDIAVFSYLGGIITVSLWIAEFIFARCIKILRTYLHGEILPDSPLPQQWRVYGPERPAFDRSLEIILLSLPEERSPGLQINGAGRCKILCALEYGAFLAIVEGDRFHIVQWKFAQIDYPVLGIPYLHSVIKNSYMLASQTADIYAFETAHTSVVLYLHAGKIAYGICYRMGA